MTEPYESPDGYHRHCCENCGYVWGHADRMKGNIAAHTCPACGKRGQWVPYEGDSEPEETTRNVRRTP